MHITRAEISTKVPIARKGTKYIARASSYARQGIPVVVAVRDMLGLARTTSEVKAMVTNKLLKINGRDVKDCKEGLALFSILEAGKKYRLTVLKTGRFALEETKDDYRIAKVIGKKILKKGLVQLNLHDGTNIISKEKINVGGSLKLDIKGKMKSAIKLDKGSKVFIMSGRSMGNEGEIKEVSGKRVKVKMEDREAILNSSHLIAI